MCLDFSLSGDNALMGDNYHKYNTHLVTVIEFIFN